MDPEVVLKFLNQVGLPTTFCIGTCLAWYFERKQNIALQAELLKLSNGFAAAVARIDAMLAVLTTRKRS